MVSDKYCSLLVNFIKVNLKMKIFKGLVYLLLINILIKAIGKIIIIMGKEKNISKTNLILKDIFIKAKKLIMENIIFKIKVITKEIFKMTNSMGKVFINGKMDADTMVNGKMDR